MVLRPSRSTKVADGRAMIVQNPPCMSGVKRSVKPAQKCVGNAASLVTTELRGT